MDYLRVSLVIAPQFLAGCLIYLLLLKRSTVNVVELISIGGVLGIATCTIFDQIFVNLDLPRIGWIVMIGLVFMTFYVFKFLLNLEIAKIIWRYELTRSLLPICAISAMALGTEWFWLFPSGVLFVIAASISLAPQKKYSSMLFKLSCLGGVAIGIFMISKRPRIWWMIDEVDYPFFAALSNSLAKNSFHIHPLISDTELKYHWFVYAWIGLVQRVFPVPAFFVIATIAPIIFVFLIVSLIWSHINRVSESRLTNFVLVAVVMLTSTFPLWGGGMKIVHLGSPSQFYAFSFLFASLFVILIFENSEIRLSVVVIALLSAVTVLSKTMHGFVLVLFLVVLILRNFSDSRSLRQSRPLILGLCSIAFTYAVFIKMPTSSDLLSLSLGGYVWQLQGDLKTFPIFLIALIGAVNIFALVVTGISLILYARVSSRSSHLVTASAVLLACSGISSFILLGDAGENIYFLHAGLATANVLAAIVVSENTMRTRKTIRISPLCLLSGSCIAVFASIIPNLNSGSPPAVLLRAIRTSFGFVCVCITVIVLIFFRHRGIQKTIISTLTLSLAMSTTFTVINWYEQYQRKYQEFAEQGDGYLGDSDLIDIATWIRSNTSKYSVIASNFGWSGVLPSELDPYSLPCIAFRDNRKSVELCRRTTDAKLVLYSERQAWLQATTALWLQAAPSNNQILNDLIRTRQKTLVEFANSPSQFSANILSNAKIQWFVVHKLHLRRTSWEPFAKIRYSNDSFLVLEMTSIK